VITTGIAGPTISAPGKRRRKAEEEIGGKTKKPRRNGEGLMYSLVIVCEYF